MMMEIIATLKYFRKKDSEVRHRNDGCLGNAKILSLQNGWRAIIIERKNGSDT